MARALDTREKILNAAEGMIRERGYHGFSTREVAAEVGVKAASVHYHFPTKSDMGAAATERYAARFLDALGSPDRFEGAPATALQVYAAAYRHALTVERRLCLCAILGAESDGLPDPVAAAARRFFERNLSWLSAALGGDDSAQSLAPAVLSALEGALIVSLSLMDESVFNRTVDALARLTAKNEGQGNNSEASP